MRDSLGGPQGPGYDRFDEGEEEIEDVVLGLGLNYTAAAACLTCGLTG